MAKVKDTLLRAYEEAFNGQPWHGPSLYKTLKKLGLEQVSFGETTEGYTVWQVALHCAYWKWNVRRQLSDGEAGKFPRKSAPRGHKDWPAPPPECTVEQWKADLDLLVTEHARLLALIARLSEKKMLSLIDGDTPADRLVAGVTAHDIYHTAQIRNMGVPALK